MSPPSSNEPVNFDRYFARTQEIPPLGKYRDWIMALPQGAHLLDFGCGTGRWAIAFLKEREDLVIDVFDQHLDKANLIGPDWKGTRYHQDFSEFTPDKKYDAIWARHTLFFLPLEQLENVMQRLSNSMKEGASFVFTIPENTASAVDLKLTGMPRHALEAMVARCNLDIDALKYNPDATCTGDRIIVPMFTVSAKRKGR